MEKMNGKPFIYFSFSDFSQPGRKTELGRHIGLEEASRAYWRQLRPVYEKLHGHPVWLEDLGGNRVAYLPRVQVMKRKKK